MHPELLRIPNGPTVYGYGTCLMVGAAAATWWSARRARAANVSPGVIVNIGLLGVIFGVIGGRLLFVVHYWERFADKPSPLWAALDVRQGGMEFLGGFALAMLAITVYLLTTGGRSADGKSVASHPVRLYLDICSPPLMLALAFTRIGCFLNGCCFGGMCTVPEADHAPPGWAVRFPFGSFAMVDQWERRQLTLPAELLVVSPDRPLPAPINRFTLSHATDGAASRSLNRQREFPSRRQPGRATSLEELREIAARAVSRPVYPAQLYASLNALCLATVLGAYDRVRRHHGTVFALMLMLYGPARFVLERIRADNPADTLGMTISQFTSLMLIVIGAGLYVAFRKRSMRLSAA